MPSDVGNQVVSILYSSSAASSIVNKRHKDVRQLGIYTGGRLDVVDNTHAKLSPLVCEISDGTHQVKVETTTLVSGILVAANEYIILRWTYAGATSDYMQILAVATPSTNDLVVGKCIFTGGVLTGFDYGDTSYPRSTPNTQDLFLKVEPTEDTELRVRIRAGRIQRASGVTSIPDQKSDLFTAPSANSKVYLLYIDNSDGTIKIDSSGTEAASPTPPEYNGKLVLAEVTLSSTDTNITVDKIKDVRSFLTLSTKNDQYLSTVNGGTQLIAIGAFQKVSLGAIKNQKSINVSSDRITLTANRKYALSFGITGTPTADNVGDPTLAAKWVVVSGDSSWDLELISYVQAECAPGIERVENHISHTGNNKHNDY